VQRIFAPLGITDTTMRPDPSMRERLMVPQADHPMRRKASETYGHSFEDLIGGDSAGGGLVSTPRAHASFEEMIRRGGSLDGVRVLSKASVRAMTHNQIPGVPDLVFGRKEASWGYGFSVICEERWPYYGGGLIPPGSVSRAGAGGIDHWIDFENGIVAAYYEQVTEISEKLEPISTAGHRFQDVITSAVLD
jgi:CubicO group peptidase (beta-lactamase class C family)